MGKPDIVPSEGQPIIEKHRTVIVDEVWTRPASPRVYALLGRKIRPGWYEFLGGGLEGDKKIIDGAIREHKEEADVHGTPASSYPMTAFPGALIEAFSDTSTIEVNTGNVKIISHPHIIRREFDELPNVSPGSGHEREHDKFVWVDVTHGYYPLPGGHGNLLRPDFFSNLPTDPVTGRLASVTLLRDDRDDRVVHLVQPTSRLRGLQMELSAVSAALLPVYLANPRRHFPPPPNFPRSI